MLIGYMRVSSGDERQSVALQRDALLAAGVDQRHLHQDRASGARDDRPGLKACLAELCEGDVLVVWKLDRLARSLPQLIETVAALEDHQRGVEVVEARVDQVERDDLATEDLPDLAVAVVDEIENPKHSRERFTVGY